MNSIIPLISVLLMFTLIPATYGAYIILSAHLLKYPRITRKEGFIFGLLIVICSSIIRAASGLWYSPPIIPGIMLGLFANWVIGSWFFSSRGASTEGVPLGWRRSMKLTGFGLVMLGLTVALLIGVPMMIMQRTMP